MADDQPGNHEGVRAETADERNARIREALRRGGVPAVVTDAVSADEIARLRAADARTLAETTATLTADEKLLGFLARVEADARAELARLEDAIARGAGARLVELLAHEQDLLRTLSKAVRDQGRLDEAVEISPEACTGVERGRAALERPDDEECDCPRGETPVVDDVGYWHAVMFPKHRLVKRVPRAGVHVYFVECITCGHANARPTLPEDLERLLGAEGDYPGDGVGPDHEIFPSRRIEAAEARRMLAARDPS